MPHRAYSEAQRDPGLHRRLFNTQDFDQLAVLVNPHSQEEYEQFIRSHNQQDLKAGLLRKRSYTAPGKSPAIGRSFAESKANRLPSVVEAPADMEAQKNAGEN